MGAVTDYFEELDPAVRAAFEHIRDVATEIAPAAQESVSYGMPALRLDGKPLLGFRAAKAHLSIFPFSPAAVEAASGLLDGYALSKGTVRFTLDRPLPDEAVRTLVRTRVSEIA
ncbi:iron chaperone [Hamadaea tsunoensis]|uniref:iron chaperone n=1 Tax=Hamadaea tsunoensis TaxID=53368 RepID=UPI0003FA6E64|nr:DUF1801 domain-containing protein [Hamadaea tsunoensis]